MNVNILSKHTKDLLKTLKAYVIRLGGFITDPDHPLDLTNFNVTIPSAQRIPCVLKNCYLIK